MVGSFKNLKQKDIIYKKFDYFLEIFNNKNKISNVLEIGCGQGELLRKVSKKLNLKKKDVIGIEPSKKIYNYLKKQNFGLFKRSFLKNFSISKKFDLILMDNVFEHFDFPNLELRKIYKILSSDGLIYISIPNIFNLNFDYEDPMNHTCNYYHKNIKYILNQNNFIINKLFLRDRVINIIIQKKKYKKANQNFKIDKKKFSNLKLKLKLNKKKISKQETRISSISKNIINKNEKIFIFGSGNYSLDLLSKMKISKNVIGYIESNKIYHGNKRNNFYVYSLKDALEIRYDKIIIASQAFKKEIYNILIKNSVKKNKIITFN